jgi:large-conductance mechanosensitive channel
MREDTEYILPVFLLLIAILLQIVVGRFLDLTLSGKYDPVLYIIGGTITLIVSGLVITVAIFFYLRNIFSYIRDKEMYDKFNKRLEDINEKEEKLLKESLIKG